MESNREYLGRKVREVWIKWAKVQPKCKDDWVIDWCELPEPFKEVDRLIGEALFDIGKFETIASPEHKATYLKAACFDLIKEHILSSQDDDPTFKYLKRQVEKTAGEVDDLFTKTY